MNERVRNRPLMAGIVVFVVMAMACNAFLQAGDDKRSADKGQASPDAESLWTHITQTDPYRNWKPHPAKGKEGLYAAVERGPVPAKNPHGGYMRLFVNETALKEAQRSEAGPMPDGAILIMEDYARDRQTLIAITGMYKVSGFAPEQGDWFWASYSPDGKVKEAGKVQSCIDCHKARKYNDWIFAGSRGRLHQHH